MRDKEKKNAYETTENEIIGEERDLKWRTPKNQPTLEEERKKT